MEGGTTMRGSRFNEKSEEEKEAIRKKISESQKKRLAKLTDKDKERISENHRQAMLNRSEEAKKKSIEKYRETMSKKDKNEIVRSRQQQVKTCKETWKNKSQEEMEEWSKLHKDIYNSFDDKKLEDIANKKREAWKNILDSMSEEERKVFNESRAGHFEQYWNSLDEKDKEIWRERARLNGRNGFKKYLDSIGGIENHRKRCKVIYSNLSNEVKQNISNKISNKYQNKSNQEKENYAKLRKDRGWNSFSKDKQNLIIDKIHKTKKINKSFGKSQLEDIIYKNLISIYNSIERQPKKGSYHYDFKVNLNNTYTLIDIHGGYYHNYRPFTGNKKDIETFNEMKTKGRITSIIADTWRYRDSERYEYCINKHINYIRIYVLTRTDLIDYNKIVSLIKDNLNKGQITLYYKK